MVKTVVISLVAHVTMGIVGFAVSRFLTAKAGLLSANYLP
jgi:hypothetical protein